MTAADRDDRLAALADELRELGERGETIDVDALARQHGLDEADVADCQRAASALDQWLAPVVPNVDEVVLPPEYEVLGELGRGGMGIVYRARHRSLGREIAIKVLPSGERTLQQLLQRFEIEARSLARLRHPHIVAVHDVGRSDGHVFYTMDLIDGTSLDKALAAGALSPSRAVRIVSQVTSAIEHSHGQGVIHRDLKPANILLDRDDTAFVADFGLARDMNMASI